MLKKLNPAARIVLLAAAILLAACAPASAAKEWKSYEELWDAIRKNWDENINTYQSDILGWSYRTKTYIREHRGQFKPNEEPPEDWVYRVYQVKFRKPNWILFSYNFSAHENTDRGGLIDRAIAHVVKFTQGTTFNFGYRGTDACYVKFPLISDNDFSKMDVSLLWKGAMKIMILASRNEIYKRPLSDLRDPRGNSVEDLIIGQTMGRFQRIGESADKDIVITIGRSPRFGRDDYQLTEDGWMSLKPAALNRPKTLYKITIEDKNLERCRHINKFETFVDPDKLIFLGLHEYEDDKLVGVTLFFNMKLNVDLPESLWEDYFKDRKISGR